MASQEPILISVQALKQDAENLSLEGEDTAQFVKQQQTLDREERAAWRDAQKIQAQAEEKGRADEIQMARINVARDQDSG